jgi:subtilisin family serine protease
MKSKVILFLSVAGVLSAHAGNQLFLRTGTVDTRVMAATYAGTLGEQSYKEFVVQFKNVPNESDRAALISRGAQIFKYLPDDAYIIRATTQSIKQIHALNQINAVVPYTNKFKVSPDFAPFSVFTSDKTESVLIKTFKAQFTKEVLESIKAVSSNIEIEVAEGSAILLNIPQNLIARVAAIQGIDHVQPYVKMELVGMGLKDLLAPTPSEDTPVNPPAPTGDYTDLSGYEDGTKVMNFDSAWAAGLTGQGQLAAMADTGLDSGDAATIHSDFGGAIQSGYIHGLFAKSWSDPMGHGTHVAGSILSRGTNSGGKIKGGAYDAKIIAQGMWSPMMENLTVPPQLDSLFKQAYTDGARVHSNSWGAARNFGSYDNFAVQADEFVWNNPEMLPVFAAGNSGVDHDKDGRIDPNSIGTPGTAKNVLTVGASENLLSVGGIQVPIKKLKIAAEAWPAEPISSDFISNNPNGIAMFSSRGPTLDGRTKPDVVAPGTNILSTRSQVPGASDLWGMYNKWYAYSGGTSMATPLTAGAALIARQKLQKLEHAAPSAALVKGLLMHTADDLFPGQFGEIGKERGQELITHRPNSDEGFGRVNVDRILNLPLRIVDEKLGVAQGQELSYELAIDQPAAKIWATLVYSDAPASSNAAKTLVNDLDIEIRTPSGKVLTVADRTNNNEIVETENAEIGTYTIVVKGIKVPQGKDGKQPFALLISAAN